MQLLIILQQVFVEEENNSGGVQHTARGGMWYKLVLLLYFI